LGVVVSIRPCEAADIGAVTAIYRHHVLRGVASFEEIPPDPAEMARRHGEIRALGLPYLVACQAARVVGFAYGSHYRRRSAYRFTVEDSIYLDHNETGRGIGRALLGALVEECTRQGYRQMVAVIGGSDQWPSIGLHRTLGFSLIGTLPAVGLKFGGWVDVVLMQRALGPGAASLPGKDGEEHG
jgi:phosphinothricin acetyltransferase